MATRYDSYEFLRVEVRGGVAHIEMTRPVYDDRGHAELSDIWRDVDRDPEVRVSLLTHAIEPTTQAKGQDYPHVPPHNVLSPEERFQIAEQRTRESRGLVYSIIDAEKPIVSTIRNGQHVMHVSLLADICVASETAAVSDEHTPLGIAAGDHGVFWVLMCGLAKAKLHLLTGDPLSGAEAASIGLIAKAVPDEEVFEVAAGYASRLANGAQHAIRYTRRALNQWMRLMNVTYFEMSAALEQLCLFSEDWETRPPMMAAQTDWGVQVPEEGLAFPSTVSRVGYSR